MATQDKRRYRLLGNVAGLYILLYLYAIGDLDPALTGWYGYVVEDPWTRMFDLRGPFYFEAVAGLELGVAVLLISPGNLLLAGMLGLLLAANLDGALELHKQAACGIGQSLGWSAGLLPALLAGGACCAPGLLLLLGLPGLGALAGLFPWLVPLSLMLLAASRLWQRRHGARAWAGGI